MSESNHSEVDESLSVQKTQAPRKPTTYNNNSGGLGRRVRTGVVGATGNTGVELVSILAKHPEVELVFGTSRSENGKSLRTMDAAAEDLTLKHPNDVVDEDIDVVFLCLPHSASAPAAYEWMKRGCRVIDLSGDLRLESEEVHKEIYETPRAPELMKQTVYGLPELNREAIETATVVSNPGCYATATALALMPLASARELPKTVCVDAKSGVSGAGRKPTAKTHFCSANEDVQPYKVGTHRHTPEVEQTLANAGDGWRTRLVFVPHLVPLERGILATAMVHGVTMNPEEVHGLYKEHFTNHPMTEVLPLGETARIRHAARTNRATLSVSPLPQLDTVVIASAIDNLGKGAAGQAVQNMNIMFRLPETLGI